MVDATPETPISAAVLTTRRWFGSRFHFSTWLALLFTAGLLFLLEVPGRRASAGGYVHGWPFVVVSRDYFQDQKFVSSFSGRVLGPGEDGNYIAVGDGAPFQELWKRDGLPAELEEAMRPWSLEAIVAVHPLAGAADAGLVVVALITVGWTVQRRVRRQARRDFLQYRLRTLLIGIAILGVVMTQVVSWRSEYQSEQQALTELAAIQGPKPAIAYEINWLPPAWLPDSFLKIGHIGAMFNHVSLVWVGGIMSGPVVETDAKLQWLAALKRIKHLEFSETDLSDAGVQQLAQHPSIESIVVRGWSDNVHISAAGVRALSRLPNLRILSFAGIGINDAAIEHVNNMPALEELTLGKNTCNTIDLHGLKRLRKFSIDCLCDPTGPRWPFDEVRPLLKIDPVVDTHELVTLAGQLLPILNALPADACPQFQLPPLVPENGIWRPVVRFDDLPSLQSVSLAGTTLTSESLRDIMELPALESLTLDAVRLPDWSPLMLQGHSRLKALAIVSSEVPEIRLENLSRLESVDLGYNDSLANIQLGQVPCLRSLRCAIGSLAPEIGPGRRGVFQGSGLGPYWGRPSWVDLRGLGSLSQIETLMLVGVRPTPATIDEISRLARLRSLDISHSGLCDADLLKLDGLECLDSLDLSGTDVTLAGLKALARMPRLRQLTLGPPATTALATLKASYPNLHVDSADGRGSGVLSGIPPPDRTTLSELLAKTRAAHTKQIITTAWMGVSDADLDRVAELTDVEWLGLAHAGLTDRGLEKLRGLKNLKVLDLSDTDITDDGLKSLAGMTRLESLSLASTFVTGKSLKHLQELKSLRVLDLSACEVSDAGLHNIKYFPDLQQLNLADNQMISDAGLAALAGLTKLRKLCLAVERGSSEWQDVPPALISDVGLIHLKGLKRLETLCLAGGGITGPGVDSLRSLPHLADLDLSGNPLTLGGLKHLAALRQLKRLSLADVPTASAAPRALLGMPNLEELSLEGVAMSQGRLASLRGFPALKYVAVSQESYRSLDSEWLRDVLPDVNLNSDWMPWNQAWADMIGGGPTEKRP